MTSSGPATAVNGTSAAAAVAQSNQDLLAEIFGSSDSTPATTGAQQAQRTTAQDILSLFDSTPAAPAPAPTAPAPAPSTSAPIPPRPAAASPPQPTQPRLVSYPAYDKNGLRISLTPQARQPGVVDIQVRFQVTGAPASDINFQAAVPKVDLPRRITNSELKSLIVDLSSRNNYKSGRSRTRLFSRVEQRL